MNNTRLDKVREAALDNQMAAYLLCASVMAPAPTT